MDSFIVDLQNRLASKAEEIRDSDPELADLLTEAVIELEDRIVIDLGEGEECVIEGEHASWLMKYAVSAYVNDALRQYIDHAESGAAGNRTQVP